MEVRVDQEDPLQPLQYSHSLELVRQPILDHSTEVTSKEDPMLFFFLDPSIKDEYKPPCVPIKIEPDTSPYSDQPNTGDQTPMAVNPDLTPYGDQTRTSDQTLTQVGSVDYVSAEETHIHGLIMKCEDVTPESEAQDSQWSPHAMGAGHLVVKEGRKFLTTVNQPAHHILVIPQTDAKADQGQMHLFAVCGLDANDVSHQPRNQRCEECWGSFPLQIENKDTDLTSEQGKSGNGYLCGTCGKHVRFPGPQTLLCAVCGSEAHNGSHLPMNQSCNECKEFLSQHINDNNLKSEQSKVGKCHLCGSCGNHIHLPYVEPLSVQIHERYLTHEHHPLTQEKQYIKASQNAGMQSNHDKFDLTVPVMNNDTAKQSICVRGSKPGSTDSAFEDNALRRRHSKNGQDGHDTRGHDLVGFRGDIRIKASELEDCGSHIRSNDQRLGGSLFKCETCEREFSSSINLKEHEVIHIKEKPYQCKVCGQRFTTAWYCDTHKRTHKGDRKFKCDMCLKTFTTHSSLNRHKIVHTDERPYKCDVCGKCFQSATYCRRHKLEHTCNKNYKCDFRGLGCPTQSSLIIHRRVHTREKPFKCHDCVRGFPSPGTCKAQSVSHTADGKYICGTSGKPCYHNSELISHQFTYSGERPFSCEECGLSFKRLNELRGHMDRFHTERRLPCALCGKKYATKKKLRRHQRVAHQSEEGYGKCAGKDTFTCEVCGDIYYSFGRFRLHKRTHSIQPIFQCRECEMSFRDAGHLQAHIDACHTERTMPYQVGEKKDPAEGKLKRHMEQLHDATTLHKCVVCKKAFSTKLDLTRHMHRHNGKSSYQCAVCGKKYGTEMYRNAHQQKCSKKKK